MGSATAARAFPLSLAVDSVALVHCVNGAKLQYRSSAIPQLSALYNDTNFAAVFASPNNER